MKGEIIIISTGENKYKAMVQETGGTLEIDANIDGSGFAPNELFPLAIGACGLALMSMAIAQMKLDIDLTGSEIEVDTTFDEKGVPKKIHYGFSCSAQIDEATKKKLETASHGNCPILNSAHPDIQIQHHFHWK